MFKRYFTVFLYASAIVFADNEVSGGMVRARAAVAYETLDSELAKVEEPAKVDSADVAEAAADSIENEKMAEAGEVQNDSEPEEADNSEEEVAENEDSETAESEEAEELAEADSAAVDSIANAAVTSLDFSNGALPTVNPVRITSPYGIRKYRLHRGVDVKVYKGDSIVAAFPGKVITSQYERRGYGHYLKVLHDNGTITVYGHLSKRLKKVGDVVEAGELIGLGGNTGRSTGSHLHFEIRYGQINIDPTKVFNFENGGLQENAGNYDLQVANADHNEIQKELSKHRIYKVRRGDTLGGIARKYGTTVSKIKKLNGLRSDRIRAGQILRCS